MILKVYFFILEVSRKHQVRCDLLQLNESEVLGTVFASIDVSITVHYSHLFYCGLDGPISQSSCISVYSTFTFRPTYTA